MRRACIDCVNLKGYSYNPNFISCEKSWFTQHPFFDRQEKGIANATPDNHVCNNYCPNYGPPYIRTILEPLINRGDTLGKVISQYFSDIPNPYSVKNSGNMLKVYDSEDGILTHHIACALSDWHPMCSESIKKPIIWLILSSIKNAAMIEEDTFYYIRTPHEIHLTRLNYELALFLINTLSLPEGKCKEHLEKILLGSQEYI